MSNFYITEEWEEDKLEYLCANCGYVEDFVYFHEELDCDLCENCCEYKDNMEDEL